MVGAHSHHVRLQGISAPFQSPARIVVMSLCSHVHEWHWHRRCFKAAPPSLTMRAGRATANAICAICFSRRYTSCTANGLSMSSLCSFLCWSRVRRQIAEPLGLQLSPEGYLLDAAVAKDLAATNQQVISELGADLRVHLLCRNGQHVVWPCFRCSPNC